MSIKQCSIITACLICLLACLAYLINFCFYSYSGNNYFPTNAPLIVLILLLAILGSRLQYDKNGRLVETLQEIFYFFLVFSVIAFATNAIQLTPYQPIDKQLIDLDKMLAFDLTPFVAWTAKHPYWHYLLGIIYDSLNWQMSLLPLSIILARKTQAIREYYCLLLLTTLFGFSVYYFLPTMGPASWLHSAYFFKEQYATGIKFNEIHQHLPISTNEGGLIAMPSFHTIWAWLCLYLVRGWRLIFYLLLPINLLLIASCVLLGWHYCVDLIGSLVMLLPAHAICFYCQKHSQDSINRESSLLLVGEN